MGTSRSLVNQNKLSLGSMKVLGASAQHPKTSLREERLELTVRSARNYPKRKSSS
jgi:hypothetical protein